MARRYEFVLVLLLAAAVQALSPAGLHAQARGITLEPLISSGLNQPVLLTNAHDCTDRRFIVEQPGRISVMRPGSSTRTTFLDLTTRVVCCGEEARPCQRDVIGSPRGLTDCAQQVVAPALVGR